jgi:Tol biopolymer transport system component
MPGGSVYIATAQGRGARRLVDGAWPSWSPDGTRIAFTYDDVRVGAGGIFTVKLDGSDRKRLVNRLFTLLPLWSPDGRTVAYQTITDSRDELNVVPASGGASRRVAVGSFVTVTWSPDSSQLAFATRIPVDGISIVGRDGKGLHVLRTKAGVNFPEWSPDGREIAFAASQAGIVLIRSDGSNEHTLTIAGNSPAWSPDSKRIAYSGDVGIWIVNRDGTGRRQLTRGDDAQPVWSPDGRSLAFRRTPQTPPGSRPTPKIWLMNANGTNQHRLTR